MESKKNILLVSHDMSMTGAPVALHYAARALKKRGDFVVVLSPYDGNMKKEILSDNIPVIIDHSIESGHFWITFADNFDLIIVSTLVQYKMISNLEKLNKPIIWWVHEAKSNYSAMNLDKKLPDTLNENIHVYCGGDYAKDILKGFRPSYKTDILLYGVSEYVLEQNKIYYKLENPENKMIFLSVGTFEFRKGQDLLAKAITEMPVEYLEKIKFIFVGKAADKKIYDDVFAVSKKYPDSVEMIEYLSRDEIRDLYQQSDCIICSSRDDPMPVFMTECMILSKILICSENTGTASLIEDKKSGFIFHNDSYKELLKIIIYIIQNKNSLEDIKKNARKIYENYFSEEVFEKNIYKIVDKFIVNEGK